MSSARSSRSKPSDAANSASQEYWYLLFKLSGIAVTIGELIFFDAGCHLYHMNGENREPLPRDETIELIAIGKQHKDVFEDPKYENLPILSNPFFQLYRPMKSAYDQEEQTREEALKTIFTKWQTAKDANVSRRPFLNEHSYLDLYQKMQREEESPFKSPWRLSGSLHRYPNIEEGTWVYCDWPIFTIKNHNGYEDISWDKIANFDYPHIAKIMDITGLLARSEIKKSGRYSYQVLER